MLLLEIICSIYFLANAAVHITERTAQNRKIQIQILVSVWKAHKTLRKAPKKKACPEWCRKDILLRSGFCQYWRVGRSTDGSTGNFFLWSCPLLLSVSIGHCLRWVAETDGQWVLPVSLIHFCVLYLIYIYSIWTFVNHFFFVIKSEFHWPFRHIFYLLRYLFLYYFSEFNLMFPNSTGGKLDCSSVN